MIQRKKKTILVFMKPATESVAGILFNASRSEVLLIQRRDVPVWVLPGGGVDAGETPEAAVVREIVEETGLTVKISRLVGSYSPINRLARHTQLFECTLLSGTPSLSNETRNVSFFPLEKLPRLIPPPYPEWICDGRKIGPPLEKLLRSVTYSALLFNLLRHPILVVRFLLARLGLAINS